MEGNHKSRRKGQTKTYDIGNIAVAIGHPTIQLNFPLLLILAQ